MRLAAALLALALTLTAYADAVEEVRRTEIAFAKAFADRDKAKFFSYVADDAVFVSSVATLRGKAAVIERWSRFFDNTPVAPFRWGPERVEVMSGGTLGFSQGPIYDANGKHTGHYSSVWQKQRDRAWKIVLDGPGGPPAALAENAAKLEEGFVPTPDGVKLHYRKLSSGSSPITIIAPLDFLWHEPLKQFADLATIVTYDGRSRGRSTVSDVKSLTIDQDVRDLETVRAHLDIDEFIPLGYSYLGKVVAMYAAAYPQHVSRVIQLGPGANRAADMPAVEEGTFGAPAEDLQRLEQLRAAKAPAHELCDAFMKVMAYRMVGDPKNAARFDRSHCALENEQNFMATFRHLWPTVLASTLSADELKKITMPVLVIHGDRDRNAHYAGGRAWAASLPDARLVTVRGAAHSPWLDDPVTVFGAVRHFIRGEWPLGSEKIQ